jgi:hypothetical protein
MGIFEPRGCVNAEYHLVTLRGERYSLSLLMSIGGRGLLTACQPLGTRIVVGPDPHSTIGALDTASSRHGKSLHSRLQLTTPRQDTATLHLIQFNSTAGVLAFILNVELAPFRRILSTRFDCKYRRLQHISRHCDRHRTVVVTGCYRQPRRTSVGYRRFRTERNWIPLRL